MSAAAMSARKNGHDANAPRVGIYGNMEGKKQGKCGATRCLTKAGVARVTGLEPATFGVTGRHSNQLSYTRIP